MRICLLGKYPPIEGGVSTQTYWLARGLAQRGHEVHMVTNADEVEAPYRMTLGDDDAPWYQPDFPTSGGSVTVYNPEAFSHGAMAHIPVSNPFVTKLAALSADIVRRRDCDIILAYYYEPYGMAGWLASRWTNKPLLLKHAGSDLDRLFAVPDLSTAYKEVLRGANGVVTQPRLMLRFLGMGVAQNSLEPDPGYAIPAEAFHPAAPVLDVARYALPGEESAPFDPGIPTIGTYGKIGRTKGTFDLIAALGRLAAEGHAFQLLALVGEAQGEMLRPHLRRAGLAGRAFILPLLPNWKVPSFLRACTAVCFLERDFPVAIHGPMVPREIMATGTCLVLSGEIAAKQRYRDRLARDENLVIVDNPKDHDALAGALRGLIVDPSRASAIGRRGADLSGAIEDHDGFAEGWEQLLARHLNDVPGGRADEDGISAGLDIVLPGLLPLLRARQPGLAEEFLAAPHKDAFQTGIALCDFAATHADPACFGAYIAPLRDALRYSRARLTAAHDMATDDIAPFPVCDRLHGKAVSAEAAGSLRPVRGSSVRVEAFDHDVAGLFLSGASGLAGEDEDVDLSAVGRERLVVLFQRAPNLAMRELRIDEPTRLLLERCDGKTETAALVKSFCGAHGGVPEERVYDALERLYRARVIVFGEYRPGWGWIGGPR